jgi:hypothetical protein
MSKAIDELLDPSKLPDDLQWVSIHYRQHPQDPVYLLLAWHWTRIKASEDTLKVAIANLRAGIDGRIEAVKTAAETVAAVNDQLAALQEMLEAKPAQLAKQIETELQKPVESAVSRLRELEATLAPLARNFQAEQRRHLLAALLIGVALGISCAFIALLA